MFTDYLRRHAPSLIPVNRQAGEFGTCWHEVFYSGLFFGHARPDDLLIECLRDRHANIDIYRTFMDFKGGRQSKPKAKAVTADFHRIRRYCNLMHSFLIGILEETKWDRYAAVGFSCLDTQVLTSLYLARLIKQRTPKPRMIFGGEAFQSYNVSQFVENFPEIDHIVVGQAEESLAHLLGRISRGEKAPHLSGVMPDHGTYRYMRSGSDRIDSFPTADFDEIRDRGVKKYSLTLSLGAGCTNSCCSFCPISSVGQHLRPPRAVLRDIRRLYAVHGKRDIDFVDWEINGDPHYLEELCDLLVKNRLKLNSWGELNARNTSPRLLRKMKRAGISYVQIGIESFSERMLKIIGKRATLVDNIKVLKWGIEAKMTSLLFNILCNHPLSHADDLTDNLRTLRLISHLLRPPVCLILNEVSLYRTSRMYRQIDKFELGQPRQFKFYRRLYPASHLRSEIPMFCMDYNAKPVANEWKKADKLLARLMRAPVALTARKLKNGATLVYDSRGRRKRRIRIESLEEEVLWACMDDTPTVTEIAAKLNKQESTVAAVVTRLIRCRLAVQSQGRILSLPIKAGRR